MSNLELRKDRRHTVPLRKLALQECVVCVLLSVPLSLMSLLIVAVCPVEEPELSGGLKPDMFANPT